MMSGRSSTDLESRGGGVGGDGMFWDVNTKLKVIAAGRRGWFTRADALVAGYSDNELRRRLRSGQWLRMSRDAYVEHGAWPADEPPWERAARLHLLTLRIASERLGDVVASHQSAAVLHGLPIWGLDLSKVHFTRSAGRIRSDRTTVIHRSRFAPDELSEVDGLRVSSVERAIAESTCAASYEVGVVLADAALHDRLTTADRLVAIVDRHRRWAGSPAATGAARFAHGSSESVGESRLRILMSDHGLPVPRLQVEIRDDSGELIGRVDFLLGEELVVEFDGALKYGANADSILAEKRREDRLRSRGYRVARVSWADLDHPAATAARLHRALRGQAIATTDRKFLVRGPYKVS